MLTLSAALTAAWITTILIFAKSYTAYLIDERTERNEQA